MSLPPTSKVKLSAPFTVTTAPFESVNSTASAANLDDAIDKPSTN